LPSSAFAVSSAFAFALSAGAQACPFFLQLHEPPLVLPQPSLAQQAEAAFGAGFPLVVLALAATASDAGAAQVSPFFLQEQVPPVAMPQDAPWQQAAFGAALLVLPSLALLSLATGVSAANARAALKVSAAIMVSILVFMVVCGGDDSIVALMLLYLDLGIYREN